MAPIILGIARAFFSVSLSRESELSSQVQPPILPQLCAPMTQMQRLMLGLQHYRRNQSTDVPVSLDFPPRLWNSQEQGKAKTEIASLPSERRLLPTFAYETSLATHPDLSISRCCRSCRPPAAARRGATSSSASRSAPCTATSSRVSRSTRRFFTLQKVTRYPFHCTQRAPISALSPRKG